jgi:hypothetical protein
VAILDLQLSAGKVSALQGLLVLLVRVLGVVDQCDPGYAVGRIGSLVQVGLSAFVGVEEGIVLVLGVRLGYKLLGGEEGGGLNLVAVCNVWELCMGCIPW